jgi:hypothetical protein
MKSFALLGFSSVCAQPLYIPHKRLLVQVKVDDMGGACGIHGKVVCKILVGEPEESAWRTLTLAVK